MLHVITRANRHHYAHELEESFRLRHQVFVVERKWKALAKADGREIDQFDTPDAIYLLAVDGKPNRVVGGSRLVPTTGSYLLSEVLPQLIDGEPPSSPVTFEWTRMHVAAAYREGHAMSETSCKIFCGVLEYALAAGIKELVIVSEMFWLPRFLELGWKPVPLGLPKIVEGVSTLAFTTRPTLDALRQTRAVRGITGSVLARQNGREPGIVQIAV